MWRSSSGQRLSSRQCHDRCCSRNPGRITQTDAFEVPYWTDHDTSNIIPSSGRYGIVSLLPRNVPTGDAARLGHVLTTAKDDRYFNSFYPSQTVSANDFTLRFQDTWFWMNSHENDHFLASSTFSLHQAPDITIGVVATNHTFGTFREDDGVAHVHLNNYRLDLTDVYADLVPDEDLTNPTEYIYDRMTVRRETSGNVITNADGGVLTAGGRVLNDQSPRDVRTTTITVTGARPTVQYANRTRITHAPTATAKPGTPPRRPSSCGSRTTDRSTSASCSRRLAKEASG
ncbi:glycosyl hydrolase family 98 C-terminal domain-containing protein [Actinopolymorpha sp. NPDC004070]|uniref:glycosyl hydrolase family 98 C-terminal domain-containing protein n=1 Tax=Actinopolymorpha sp. NPDC004070 TaxID=3154548 RepID=UPI0033A0234C